MKLPSKIVMIACWSASMASAQNFCPGASCTKVWGIFDTTNQSTLVQNDSHGGATLCTSPATLDLTSQQLTLSYLGNDAGKSNTCYVRIKNIPVAQKQTGNTSFIPNGYLSAHIAISPLTMVAGNTPAQGAAIIWPAFWLVGSDYGSWPTSGEIDIAERIGGVTATHLWGDPTNTFSNGFTFGTNPAGLRPDGSIHEYGLAWAFNNSLSAVTLTSYFDGNLLGQQTLLQSGGATDPVTQTNVFNALKSGKLSMVFDTDVQGSSVQKYTMTVSDSAVYSVSGAGACTQSVTASNVTVLGYSPKLQFTVQSPGSATTGLAVTNWQNAASTGITVTTAANGQSFTVTDSGVTTPGTYGYYLRPMCGATPSSNAFYYLTNGVVPTTATYHFALPANYTIAGYESEGVNPTLSLPLNATSDFTLQNLSRTSGPTSMTCAVTTSGTTAQPAVSGGTCGIAPSSGNLIYVGAFLP